MGIKTADSKHAVLIGAGDMENIGPVITENDFIIALDGGLVFCEEHSIVPDMIVGDFDSLPRDRQELLAKYPKEIIQKLPCEKDDTDTLAAIKTAVEKGYSSFSIYGGLGGRLSHTLANIQALMYLKERGMHGELVGERCLVFLIKDESITLLPQENGYISIFSYLEKAKGVTLKNLKYEVEDAELDCAFPLGVSNEFIGKTAEISVKQGVLLVVMEDICTYALHV